MNKWDVWGEIVDEWNGKGRLHVWGIPDERIVPVSAETGTGIEELKAVIAEAARVQEPEKGFWLISFDRRIWLYLSFRLIKPRQKED